MDRRNKALTGISVSSSFGLEIGPLATPFVRRTDGRILYADHATTDELRRKYIGHGWDTNSIVEVDIVLSDQPLRDHLKDIRVDYIVASHVIEHVPDLVSWLIELGEVLRPGGVVSLVIPDKRYCFDAKRPVSTTGELVEAFLIKRRTPMVRQVFDFWACYCQVDCADMWNRSINVEDLPLSGTLLNALEHAEAVSKSTAYADVHCWVFTPTSFMNCMADLTELSMLSFKPKHAVDTAINELEFFVMLEPMCSEDDPSIVANSFRCLAQEFRLHRATSSRAESQLVRLAKPLYRTLKRFVPTLATSIRRILKR
ncbi:MAG TPA: class I SAM-dependent methyltransferase [Acidimicrobiia bacterium]|nr:class I SAM-dependent methyltransferase [Acidimicrobiia bacterium]